jgi:hypothetical protein
MTRGAWWSLFGTRALSCLAVLAGFAGGAFGGATTVLFSCFDSCSSPDEYFSRLALAPVAYETPCIVLELLGLVLFMYYCRLTQQPRKKTIAAASFFVAGGLVGGAILWAFLAYGQATLPVQDGLLVESPVESWAQTWALLVIGVAVVWSGILAYLQRGGV